MLLEITTQGTYFGATIDVLLFVLGTILITSLFWYFWQKEDKQTIEALEKSAKKLKPKYDTLQNQHEHLRVEHGKLKQGLSELIETYQTLQTQHENFVNSQSSAQNLYEQADEERQALLDSYEAIETNYNSLDNRYNDLVTTMDRLEEEAEGLREQNATLREDNNKLKINVKNLEQHLEEEGFDVPEIVAQYQAELASEEDEIEQLIGAALHRKEAPKSELSETLNSESQEELKTAYEALKEDYNNLRNEYTQLNNEFSTLQEKLNQFEDISNNVSAMESADQVAQENERLIKELSELREEHEQVVLPKLRATQTLLNQKEENYRILTAQLEAKNADFHLASGQNKNFDELRATNQALFNSNKMLAEQNADLEKQYNSLRGEYNSLQSQFHLIREQFIQVEKELDTQLLKVENKAEFEQLSKEYGRLKVELLATSDRYKQQTERLTELENRLKAINESTAFGIIYLPSNLQIIEGIEASSEQILNKVGINSWEKLAQTNISQLVNYFSDGSHKVSSAEADDWIQQARHLYRGNWKEFRDLEASLIAQKRASENAMDDLKVIEGVGPKIELLLNDAGISTWKKLSKTGIGELKRILKEAGTRYNSHNPSSWPEQAALAATHEWERLELLKADLNKGRQSA